MKHLTVIVKPFRAEAVLEALARAGLEGVVREAKGYGRQKGYLDKYRGSEFSMAYLAKVEITAAVPDDEWEAVTDEVAKVARTGRIGDGKVFAVAAAMEAIEF
jgi:nitrogen regulatory protein PII